LNQIDLLARFTKWARTVHETGRLGELTGLGFPADVEWEAWPFF